MNDLDKRAVIVLRDAYLKGETSTSPGKLGKALGIESWQASQALQRFQSLGVVHDDSSDMAGSYWPIQTSIVDLAKTLETPPDHTAGFMVWIKQNPWTAGVLMLFVGGAFLIGFVNQLWELADRIRGKR